MEALAIVVMLLALLALAGVVTFFLWDYFKHKDENEKTFVETQQRVDAEKKDRLGNIKFVVDQVNEVNKDIYKEMTSNVGLLKTSTSSLESSQKGLIDGLGTFLRFSSNQGIQGAPQPVSLLNLPGTTSPNVELLQRVTAVMGLTAMDLGSSGKSVKFCGTDPSRCIEFPNSDGDVVITSLKAGSNVVINAPTRVKDELRVGNTRFLSGGPNTVIQSPGNVGIGSTSFSNPQAQLHVQGVEGTTGDVFKVSVGSGNSGDAILVNANGDIVTYKPIKVKNIGGTDVAVVGLKPGFSNTLQIASPYEVELNADVRVTKKLIVKDLEVTDTAKLRGTSLGATSA